MSQGRTISSGLVSSLAKVCNPKLQLGQKPTRGRMSMKLSKSSTRSPGHMETWFKFLTDKMGRLLKVQEKVLNRLDGMSQDIGGIERDMKALKQVKVEVHLHEVMGRATEVKEMCHEITNIVSAVNKRSEQQARKLEGMEKLVLGFQRIVEFLGEEVKSSSLTERMFKSCIPVMKSAKEKNVKRGKQAIRKPLVGIKKPSKLRDHKAKDGETTCLNLKSQKTQKKKPPDTTDTISLRKKALLHEEVQKLNQQNAEAASQADGDGDLLDFILDVPVARTQENELSASALQVEEVKDLNATWLLESIGMEDEEEVSSELVEEVEKVVIGEKTDKERDCGPTKKVLPNAKVAEKEEEPLFLESGKNTSTGEAVPGGQRNFTGHVRGKEEQEKSRAEELCTKAESTVSGHAHPVKDNNAENEQKQEYIIDCSPPPPAPFDHRIVSAMHSKISNFYTINREEILGEGRFGQVHKCVENSSGLTLAAKVIKARSQKEKEVVKNEIQVMNQLNHTNLIQLYAAYESKNDIILVMEYVDGGELFDRIIDESYNLTELETVLFIRQISEGLRYMHHMYILHLDLKPENILCVSRATYKIKIIDFGLARRYKPRERLRVNFGTPEFLAPEVINYEFVSFPTDMWSLGVISYMLISGLSPFLGEDDNETLNNILACQWSFEEEEFADISEEAKDFVSRLLVKSMSWRMSAAEALKHPFLSDCGLHYRLWEKKNKCRSSRSHQAKS